MFHFTTYFDKNYLSRGLVLYDSLKQHCVQFELYILCLDDYTLNYFQVNIEKYPEIKTFSLNEIEEYDIELKESKKNRSLIEYYFTLSPCLPLYILKKYNIPHICSLDADIMFFSSPAVIFSYLEKYSILITPHNFSPETKSREIYGKYNVSFQIFKNDEQGLICLENWRSQCIDWCYDKLEDGKFADQKYLDDWENKYEGVHPINVLGSGVAPWNINAYAIKVDNNQLYINDDKLIFYHFHGLRSFGQKLFVHRLTDYGVKINKMITRHIYKPYIKNILIHQLINDYGIIRMNTHSPLKIILFQDWFYYKAGILFEKNKFLKFLSRSIICTKNNIKKWLK